MKQQVIVLSVFILAVIVLFVFLRMLSNNETSEIATMENVGYVDDEQHIAITARGGYFPARTIADADVKSRLLVYTDGTYDCSSALTIPALGYSNYLPANGVTEIVVPPQSSGTTLQGLCTMGMYRFAIDFK